MRSAHLELSPTSLTAQFDFDVSTLNHVFSLKFLIDIFFSKNKKITVPLSISKTHSILFGDQVYG